MEWSACSCMFTREQVARVHHTLNDAFAHRSHLWSASNLAATCATPTDISQSISGGISICPNPFASSIMIQGLQHPQARFRLTDMIGQPLIEEQHTAAAQLHLADIPAGIYTLCIEDGNGVRSFKVIKVQ